jgi:uncharacterized membrane protein YczE
MLNAHPHAELRLRLPRLLLGLVLCGVGISLMVAGDLGLGPWDVLHQGLERLTGVSIGAVSIGVGALVMLAWIPLGERPGLGTVLNVLLIGIVIDATLLWLDTPSELWERVAMTGSGPVLFAVGSGFYLGAGLGSGPRDGIMTALGRRGVPIGAARGAIELTVLAGGWMLGGTVGLGTVLFAVSIGPLVHWAVPRLAVPTADPPPRGTRSAR